MKRLLFILLTLFPAICFAQDKAIGSWASHFAYTNARSVAYDGKDKVYAADLNLFAYSTLDNEYTVYSKVNGLSDVGINLIRYNTTDDYLLIIYENGNIDILSDDGIINIPDIKNLQISGSRNINDIYFFNKFAYLSTDLGIVVLDPSKNEIKETYVLQNGTVVAKVNSFTNFQQQFVAATDQGIYVANENNPILQDFNNWTNIDNKNINHLLAVGDNRIFLAEGKTLHTSDDLNTGLNAIYTSQENIVRLNEGFSNIYVCENGNTKRAIQLFDNNANAIDSFFNVNAFDVAEVGSSFYIADGYIGLVQVPNKQDRNKIHPDGPFANAFFNLNIAEDKLIVSGGGHAGWNYQFSSTGIYTYDYNNWTAYNRFDNVPAMDSTFDIVAATIDPKTKSIYGASYGGGLLEIKADGDAQVFKNNGFINNAIGDPGGFRVFDLAFDNENNLWMTNYGANTQLVVKKTDNSWQKFSLPFPSGSGEKSATQLLIDNSNQKWVIGARGVGLMVMNDNNTIDNTNDDVSRLLSTGLGRGNLPNIFVNCMAQDKDGLIWVGTNDGIGIFNCPESILTTNGCDAELKIVQYDENAGLLFQSETVKSIAVDGGNNKWIGTNNGVWQISEDAETILQRFNTANSPLPSDEVNKIVVHPKTGDVFIATNKGLVSYRGNATEGNETNDEILVFPNPVPSNYQGTIAIKGLTENADVRITDVSGQLVYRTTAQGGQATWNGMTYTGKRPMTGIYYVFVTNKDGSQTKTTKFMFSE